MEQGYNSSHFFSFLHKLRNPVQPLVITGFGISYSPPLCLHASGEKSRIRTPVFPLYCLYPTKPFSLGGLANMQKAPNGETLPRQIASNVYCLGVCVCASPRGMPGYNSPKGLWQKEEETAYFEALHSKWDIWREERPPPGIVFAQGNAWRRRRSGGLLQRLIGTPTLLPEHSAFKWGATLTYQ